VFALLLVDEQRLADEAPALDANTKDYLVVSWLRILMVCKIDQAYQTRRTRNPVLGRQIVARPAGEKQGSVLPV
jgi:hypothetical protein